MSIQDILLDRKLDVYMRDSIIKVYDNKTEIEVLNIVFNIISNLKNGINRPILIFIGGGTASGKTTFVSKLVNIINENNLNVCSLSTDGYVIDTRELRRERELQVIAKSESIPDPIKYEEFLKRELIQSKYDFSPLREFVVSNTSRMGKPFNNVAVIDHYTGVSVLKEVNIDDIDIIIVEGDIPINIPCDFTIYMDTNVKLREDRFIDRNMNERNYSYNQSVEKFNDILKYQHFSITSSIMSEADLILDFNKENYKVFHKNLFSESQDCLLSKIRKYLIKNSYKKDDAIHSLNTEKWFCLLWKFLYGGEPHYIGRIAALLHDVDRILNLKNKESLSFEKENEDKLGNLSGYVRKKKIHSLWCASLAKQLLENTFLVQDIALIESSSLLIQNLEPVDLNMVDNHEIIKVLSQADACSYFQKNISHYKKTRSEYQFVEKVNYTISRFFAEIKNITAVNELSYWIQSDYNINMLNEL